MIKERLQKKKKELHDAQGKLWKMKKHDPKYKAACRKVNQLRKAVGNLEFLLLHEDKFDTLKKKFGVCKTAAITYDTLHVTFYGLEGTFYYSKSGVLGLLHRNA